MEPERRCEKVNSSTVAKDWRYEANLTCVCGTALFARQPDGCDLVCDSDWRGRKGQTDDPRCKCVNGKAGMLCDKDVCRLGRGRADLRLHCVTDSHDHDCLYIDKTRDRQQFPVCPCRQNAALTPDGFCDCPEGYKGLLCQLRLSELEKLGSASSAKNYGFSIGVPGAMLGAFLLFCCCYFLARRSNRRGFYQTRNGPHQRANVSNSVPMTNMAETVAGQNSSTLSFRATREAGFVSATGDSSNEDEDYDYVRIAEADPPSFELATGSGMVGIKTKEIDEDLPSYEDALHVVRK